LTIFLQAEDDQPDLKRFKVDVARDEEFGAIELPKEMLKIIINHLEARELSLVIVSARYLQDLLFENEWLLVYAGRWRRNRVLSARENIIINIEGKFNRLAILLTILFSQIPTPKSCLKRIRKDSFYLIIGTKILGK
jgi:hypothetical protein